MTVERVWKVLLENAISGRTPEYWARIKNDRIWVQRNYQGCRTHTINIPLEKSVGIEDTEWIGLDRDPELIILDMLI